MQAVEARTDSNRLRVVGGTSRFPKVGLQEPTASGYLLLAAEIDRRPPFLPNSRAKRALIERLKRWCSELRTDQRVLEAVVFDALLIPPGRGEFLRERPGSHVARYDLAVLVETTTRDAAGAVGADAPYLRMVTATKEVAHHVMTVRASNVKRIAPVDHAAGGVFLFNYFVADDAEQNLAVWEYTAGWFQHETGLDNSTVFLPEAGEDVSYKIINHCRWDQLRDFLPALLLKPSFRSYVLANFRANRVAAQPIVYRLA